MRIIGGSARGRKLITDTGLETRPTAERTREALFNILMQNVPGACLLDVFSGSGAVCAEALSRGASYTAAIDISRTAVDIIKKNTALKGIEGKCVVYHGDWAHILPGLKCVFDIVYIDPPYRLTDVYGKVFRELVRCSLIGKDSIVVTESEKSLPEDTIPEARLTDERRYGKAVLGFWRIKEV